MRTTRWLLVLIVLGLVRAGDGDRIEADEPARDPAIVQYEAALLEIAKRYREELSTPDRMPRQAPELCRAPIPQPPRPRLSEAGDSSPHGEKLYFVFARDLRGYLRRHELEAAPVEQVLVKESWQTEEGDGPAPEGLPAGAEHKAVVGERVLRATRRGPLFVMMKRAPDAPHSDAGWVYATLDAEGKTVTAAGRIASCMSCHVEASHDRQFGIPGINSDAEKPARPGAGTVPSGSR